MNIPHNIEISDLKSLGVSYQLQANQKNTTVIFIMPKNDPCEQHYVYALVPLNDSEYQEIGAVIKGNFQSFIIDSRYLKDAKFSMVCDANSYDFKFTNVAG